MNSYRAGSAQEPKQPMHAQQSRSLKRQPAIIDVVSATQVYSQQFDSMPFLPRIKAAIASSRSNTCTPSEYALIAQMQTGTHARMHY